MTLRIALVLTGEELLRGTRADANGPWLAARLTAMGATVVSLSASGDGEEDVARVVAAAATRAAVVVVSGGLGPTRDDRTREGIALAAGVDLEEDPQALASIARVLQARGLALDGGRRRQSRVPRGGHWIPNPDGTAPGIEVRVGDATVYALPGVPRELESMFEASVRPALQATGLLEESAEECVPTAGVAESEIARAVDDLAVLPRLDLGFYPHEGEVEIRVRSRGAGAGERVLRAAAEIRRRLGPAAWGEGPIEAEVVRILRARRILVTTAESMTGGLVARMLTSVAGASDVFAGGWVTYSDAWKASALGVPLRLLEGPGAVSPEVALAMVDGARERAGAGAALAVTGVAGPGDGMGPGGREIPQGTFHVAAVLADRPAEVRSHLLPLGRTTVQRRAAVLALDLLRRLLGS